MSLTATLNTALSGLTVTQRALSVTANNITNAGTEGYARKEIQPQTRVVAGHGRGVVDAGTARVVDQYLAAELRVQSGRLAADREVSEALDRVQSLVFGAPGDEHAGVTPAIDRLRVALEGFASTPERAAQRVGVVGAADELFDRLAASGTLVQDLRRDLDQEIGVAVRGVNSALLALDQVNNAISRDGATADLLDRRDQIVVDIAAEMDVHVYTRENGTVAVYGAAGAALLDGQPRVIVYRPSASVGPTSSFAAMTVYRSEQMDPATGLPQPGAIGIDLVSGGVRAELTPELAGDAIPDEDQLIVSSLASGRIAGLVAARDVALPQIADLLGELADLAGHVLNAAHNSSVAQPPPDSLSGTRTDLSGWNGAGNAGTAYLAVIDRTTDATLATVAVDMTAATVGDLVTQINAGLGGLATASINGAGALQIDTASPDHGLAQAEGDSTIAWTDGAGRDRPFGFAHWFGLNDLIVAEPATGGLAVRADILTDPSRLAAARLDVEIGPPLTATLGGSGDNRGAQALAGSLDRPTQTIARAGLPAGQVTLGDYAGDVTSMAARAAASAADRTESRQALVNELAFREGAVSDVNLDEELARLVAYQQAYAVAARLISVTDELFGELLGIAR